MKTYQDFEKARTTEAGISEFIMSAIQDYQSSTEYKMAKDAEAYASGKNITISKYQKLLYKITGEVVPDNFNANHKCKSGFFKRFVTQETSFEVGNGVTFQQEATKKRLGKNIDQMIYKGVKSALIEGVSFGFWNLDHIEFYKRIEFIPLWDEETGKLRAGIRFWKLSNQKPLNVKLLEEDGYTTYRKPENGNLEIVEEKRGYKVLYKQTPADGVTEQLYENYPGFPVVPLWGNLEHQSELEGHREQIDCYDLIKSGFANDLDDASMIYWTLTNCGGMEDEDIATFIERLKTLHAANMPNADDGAKAEAHTMEVPYQSRETYLTRLKKDLYEDFMALDVEQIAAGDVTATQIEAAYEPISEKCDELEMNLFDFFHEIFNLAGITDDEPQFKRAKMSNISEQVQTILLAAEYLGEEETTRQICAVMGISDSFDEIMKARAEEAMNRTPLAEE